MPRSEGTFFNCPIRLPVSFHENVSVRWLVRNIAELHPNRKVARGKVSPDVVHCSPGILILENRHGFSAMLFRDTVKQFGSGVVCDIGIGLW